MTIEGSGLGVHRSIDPTGVLPQTAWRLDNRPQLWPIEARLEVEVLALDSVVLRRLRDAVAGDPELVVARGHVSGAAEDAFELLTTYPALPTLVSQGSGPAFDSSPTLAGRRDTAAGGGRAGQIRDAAAGGGRAGQHA